MMKTGLKYVGYFVTCILLLVILLVGSAFIPNNTLQKNFEKSADYLCSDDVFIYKKEGVKASEIDRYADSILLGIAYQYDADNPLKSVMLSSYYYTSYQNENDNLADAVYEHKEANQQYMRYWHGSIAIVRGMLIFTDIQHIYWINAGIMIILILALLWVLFRKQYFAPAISLILGMIAVSVWYVPHSLEYTWIFLIMLVASLIAVYMVDKGKTDKISLMFLVTGMVSNYLDFLTTETITLLVPLILVVWIANHGNDKTVLSVKQILFMSLMWFIGYAGMWIMKWIMAAIVLQDNILPYVTGHIQERVGGNIGLNAWQWFTGVIGNNVKCLFPAGYGSVGMVAAVVLIVATVYYAYVYHIKPANYKVIMIYAIIGIVPYIRYIVLHNHSYIHCFFTYRAQIATIMAVILIIADTTKRKISYGNKKR